MIELMLKGMVKLWGWRCGRCSHEWIPRNRDERPKFCPKCKSPYWDKPRKHATAGADTVEAEKVTKDGE